MISTISCPQRRIDVWIGRLAAVAGIAYVALASLWSMQADAATTAARTPRRTPPSLDVRLAGAVADVARRESPANRRGIAAIRPALFVEATADRPTGRRA